METNEDYECNGRYVEYLVNFHEILYQNRFVVQRDRMEIEGTK